MTDRYIEPEIWGTVELPTAKVTGSVYMNDEARVTGHARVDGTRQRETFGFAVRLRGSSEVSGNALVDSTNVFMGDGARITDNVRVFGGLSMDGDSALSDDVVVTSGFNEVTDNARVSGSVVLGGGVTLSGDAHLHGAFRISNATIRRDGEIRNDRDFATFRYHMGTVTLHRTKGGGALVNAGCQSFGLDERPSFYKELAEDQDWHLPEYFSLMLEVFRKHAEKYF